MKTCWWNSNFNVLKIFLYFEKMNFLFLGYRNGNCGRGPVFMWIFILFPDQFFCFVADWPPRLLFFIFWFQNAQKLWSNSLSSSSVPQRKHDSVSKSVSFHQKLYFFVLRVPWPANFESEIHGFYPNSGADGRGTLKIVIFGQEMVILVTKWSFKKNFFWANINPLFLVRMNPPWSQLYAVLQFLPP